MSLTSAVDAAYRVEKIPGGDEVVGDFVVGPTKVELAIMPGSEKSLELLVTNRMGDRRQFNLEIEDAKGSTDPSQTVVLLGADRGPYSLRDYIYFDEASFVLEQGERARIPVTVRIPEDAPPGGLYGSVLVTTSSVAKEGDDALQSGAVAGSVIISRIGALFFVTVPGAVAREGALEKFTTVPSGKELFDLGPINFQVLFANTGSVHLNPSAVVSIKNMFGKEVASIEAEPWFALPQSVRMREITWPQKYLFGRYTADITLNRGYDNKTDTASVSFWVIPKMLVGGAFIVLTLIFFLLRFILRTFEIKKKR
ncbi:hypothetical protein K2X96_03470 [Patescibacteria group bacterium]|nr:hypothetical protein [Patescibacteria group bacterium]